MTNNVVDFAKIDMVSAYVDLRRSLNKAPCHSTANALALIGEDLRSMYGIDLRPYYSTEELIGMVD